MLPDSSFIAAGGSNNPRLGGYQPAGMLSRISKHGEHIWTRYISKYNAGVADDYVYDMIIAPDGGYLLSGYVINNYIETDSIFHRNDAWLAKTDSCGFTVGDVPEPLFVIDSIVGLTAYISNQSENYCTGAWHITTNDSSMLDSLSIYAYSQFTTGVNPTQLQYTFPDTGNYNITLTTRAGDSLRSYSLNFGVYDTATNINNITPNSFQNLISVFPNPSKDYVIIELDKGLEQILNQSRYTSGQHDGVGVLCELVNLNGQVVKQVTLNPKLYQQQINHSSINNGIYIMQFSYENQSIGYQRISVVR